MSSEAFDSLTPRPPDDPFTAWAWVGPDETGGPFCTLKPNLLMPGTPPLVSHDRAVVDTRGIERQVQQHADRTGVEVRLVMLQEVETLRIVRPRTPDEGPSFRRRTTQWVVTVLGKLIGGGFS